MQCGTKRIFQNKILYFSLLPKIKKVKLPKHVFLFGLLTQS